MSSPARPALVIQLQKHKLLVTASPSIRLQEHISGAGTLWYCRCQWFPRWISGVRSEPERCCCAESCFSQQRRLSSPERRRQTLGEGRRDDGWSRQKVLEAAGAFAAFDACQTTQWKEQASPAWSWSIFSNHERLRSVKTLLFTPNTPRVHKSKIVKIEFTTLFQLSVFKILNYFLTVVRCISVVFRLFRIFFDNPGK